MHILWLDFETRSRVNLKTHGVYRYVACPDHRILCAGYALDMGPTKGVVIGPDQRLPDDLRNMLDDKRIQIRAHNAGFDRNQLKGKAQPPIERWYCTMAQARGAALPGSLENLGRALDADIRKSPQGADLMSQLSWPDKHGRFNDDPELMRQFALYCGIDVDTMRNCSLGLPELRPEDLDAYHASERVNDRGLPIDVELCTLALKYAKAEKIEAAAEVVRLSGGAVRTSQGTTLTHWVYRRIKAHNSRLCPHMETAGFRLKDANKGRGEKSIAKGGEQTIRATLASDPNAEEYHGLSLALDVRRTLLDIAGDNPDAIEPDVVEMIEANEAGSVASTAKFKAMLNRVDTDGRLRGAFVFNGAYQTNRWSSTGAQVHNYPRQVAEDPEAVLRQMRQDKPLDGTLRTLKGMLRPSIAPKDRKVIVRADWNAVEARALPWLADSDGAREYMEAFKDETRDIYVEQSLAVGLGGLRQPGKVVVLSLGYGGSLGALTRMARAYDVHIPDGMGVVRRWRFANPWVAHKQLGWWESLKRCAFSAMDHPGRVYRAGRVTLCKDGDNLTMTLPSGRVMHYPMAEVRDDGPYGREIWYLKAAWKPKAGVKTWPMARLWHGVLAENATQAVCADLMREALVRAERGGIEVIGHVHDELIAEAPPARAQAVGRALQRCMLASSKWAAGLPLKVEIDIAPRFRK